MGNIKVGTAGWRYDDWHGIVYPANKPDNFQELTFISQLFDVVEINSTFYHPPKAATAQGWVRKTCDNPNFCFTAKLWRQFTHSDTVFSQNDVKIFKEGLAPLTEAGRLEALLAQFPWRFKNSERGRTHLIRIMDAFKNFPLVIEFRHASWDNEATRVFLDVRGVGFASVDQPVIGHSIAPKAIATGDIGYVRLHGRNYENWFGQNLKTADNPIGGNARYDYLYRDKELTDWAKRTLEIAAEKRNTFVIQNNHPWGQAVANAIEMKARLGQDVQTIPDQLLTRFPNLGTSEEIK